MGMGLFLAVENFKILWEKVFLRQAMFALMFRKHLPEGRKKEILEAQY